jgi:hypothetical protein
MYVLRKNVRSQSDVDRCKSFDANNDDFTYCDILQRKKRKGTNRDTTAL